MSVRSAVYTLLFQPAIVNMSGDLSVNHTLIGQKPARTIAEPASY